MQKPTLTVAAAFALWSAAAHADDFTDTVIERYQDMGFQFIEVKRGPTQLKVEAIKRRWVSTSSPPCSADWIH